MSELTAYWQDKAQHLEQLGRADAASAVRACLAQGPFRSFWHYDDALVAPLHGYQDVHDYYRRASPRQYLSRIARPTLLIQSGDDPFMTPEVLPEAQELSPDVYVELCQHGGHVGFIEGGTPRVPLYYLERRIPCFLDHQWQAIQDRGELLG
jgi:predicted alpha/beta-fold hydrolase